MGKESLKKKTKKPHKGDPKRMNLFLSLDEILVLERIRQKRLIEGAELGEVNKSKLIREGIELLRKQEGV